MRPVREITAEAENFRVERNGGFNVIRRDSIQPERIGTIVLMAFRITEYRKDCDGSLMATLEQIDKDGEITGFEAKNLGLYPEADLVVTSEELVSLFEKGTP